MQITSQPDQLDSQQQEQLLQVMNIQEEGGAPSQYIIGGDIQLDPKLLGILDQSEAEQLMQLMRKYNIQA